MLARKIVSIHPAVILAVMFLCAAGPTVWSWIVRPSVDDLLTVYRVATAPFVVARRFAAYDKAVEVPA